MLNLTKVQQHQIKQFRECFVEHPGVSEIYEIFDRLRLNKSLGGEQESFLLTGETGCGKTAIINHYLKRFQDSTSRWGEQKILSTRIPSRVKEQDTLQQLLTDLNSKTSTRLSRKGNERALATSLVRQLNDKNVELIIVNEIQELMEFTNADDRQTIANTFKMISEDAGVSFVLVGMPYSVLLADEPQWSSRLSWRRSIDYFRLFKTLPDQVDKRVPDVVQKRHFAMFVAGLASRMGFEEKPNLTSDELLIPLFALCRGECRKLKHFLADAMLTCFQLNKEIIDLEVLKKTYNFKFPQSAVNPFDCDLTDLEVKELKSESKYNKAAIVPEERLIAPKFTDYLPVSMLLSKSKLNI